MNDTTKRDGQQGFVSIIVTMIIMVLLSLIVLGFAKISRREQRQGLDRQLISQAQYAAESGINDAQAYLKAGGTLSTSANTACNSYAVTSPVAELADPTSGAQAGSGLPRSSTISDNTVLSCVLVDTSVKELVYDSVDTASEIVVPIRLQNDDRINTIRISWQGSAGSDYSGCQSGSSLPPANNWYANCGAGVLRTDIAPGGTLSRTALTKFVKGLLLIPQRPGTAATTNVNTMVDSATPLGVPCNGANGAVSPRACTVTITTGGATSYYLRIRPVYQSAYVSITVNPDAAGAGQALKGAQATIDSTARANDVLKRLVARVPACSASDVCGRQPAGFAIQTADSICKRYSVIPPSTIENSGGSDPSCALP